MSPALCASRILVILYFFRYRPESTKYMYLSARGTLGKGMQWLRFGNYFSVFHSCC